MNICMKIQNVFNSLVLEKASLHKTLTLETLRKDGQV